MPGYQRGAWVIGCPRAMHGCTGYTEFWQLDDGSAAPQGWTLARSCTNDCDAHDMAEMIVLLAGRGHPHDYLPPITADEYAIGLLRGVLRNRRVSEAWTGAKPFLSSNSRVGALGHRMREARAAPPLVAFGQAMLASNLGVVVDLPIRLVMREDLDSELASLYERMHAHAFVA